MHVAADVDLLDDAAIARAETGIILRVAYELDPRTDGHTRTNASREKACADGIHAGNIGSGASGLEPSWRSARRSRGTPVEVGLVGGPFRTRRLWIGPPTATEGVEMTSPSHDERPGDDPQPTTGHDGGSRAPKLFARGPSSEERLEQLLAERRREIEEHAHRVEGAVSDLERREELVRDARTSVERALRVGAVDLEAREADLAELSQELAAREARLRAEEAGLARRRSEVGAVELKRAAVEQREQALNVRETELDAREAALAEREASAAVPLEDDGPSSQLLFVPGSSYRIVEIERSALRKGDTLEHDDEEYVVGRLGPSPLPGDERRCAYLVRGPRRASPDDGSE
jgi:hypothetical protein